MKLNKLLAALIGSAVVPAALAGVYPQCPADVVAGGTNSTDPETGLITRVLVTSPTTRKVCLHLTAGDGWLTMGDGTRMYAFGFSPANPTLAGRDAGDAVMINGFQAAQFSAPKLTFRQGDEVWLALTNVGMVLRPDLFDQHSVHWHGFPQASAIFDGVPNASVTVNMGSTFTYYYKVVEAGTFIYHCHVESTEHMEMGMLGILNVEPNQNTAPAASVYGFSKFAYNDGDGSTGYHRDYSLQLGGMDSNFHDLHERVQPLPFLELKTDYTTFNGRGYPMTTIANKANMQNVVLDDASELPVTQPISALITATAGERVLLRMTNLNIVDYFTVTALGVPMRVVGRGAHIARGPSNPSDLSSSSNLGTAWAHNTSSVTLGGGEGVDVMLDLQGVAPGTYYLYTTNLNFLSNGASDDRGGLMTKIVVN